MSRPGTPIEHHFHPSPEGIHQLRTRICYGASPRARSRARSVSSTERHRGQYRSVHRARSSDLATVDAGRGSGRRLRALSGLSAYKQRTEGRGNPSEGRGARWEGAVITEELYAQFPASQSKFIAVVLEGCSSANIPDILMPVGRSYYHWPDDEENLYRRLTRQPRVTPAPLGDIVQLDGVDRG